MALAHDSNGTADDFNITAIVGDFLNDTEYTDIFAEELAYVLHVILTPILIIVGVMGNLLSIIVFYKSKLRGQSTSQYLSALAVSDTIFLLQLIPPWLKAVKASLVFVRSGFCQLFVYLTYVSSANSSWLVVAFTVERFVAVIYPLRSRACTVRRARVCVASVGATCLLLNTPVLWFAEARGADCAIDLELMEYAARFNVLDTVLSFTLPLAITTVLNIWIMVGVCRGGSARRRLTRAARVPPRRARASSRPRLARRTRSQEQRSQQRVTTMLLLVSSVFVLLNLPAYSMRIVAYAMNMSSYKYSGRWASVQQICQLLFNVNFGINFFLFCLSGQNFRRALAQTLPCAARMLRRLFCCGEEPPPPPAPPANSVSTNTEGDINMARLRGGTKWVSCWTRERTAQGQPYLQLWHFDNVRQMHRFQELHMDASRVLTIRSTLHRERPNPIEEPQTTNDVTPACEHGELFRPIPFNIVPGQIAPLGTDSFPVSPGLAPSPSPPAVERGDVPVDNDNDNGTAAAEPNFVIPNLVVDDMKLHFAPVVLEKEDEEEGMMRALQYSSASLGVPLESARVARERRGRRPLCERAAGEESGRATM